MPLRRALTTHANGADLLVLAKTSSNYSSTNNSSNSIIDDKENETERGRKRTEGVRPIGLKRRGGHFDSLSVQGDHNDKSDTSLNLDIKPTLIICDANAHDLTRSTTETHDNKSENTTSIHIQNTITNTNINILNKNINILNINDNTSYAKDVDLTCQICNNQAMVTQLHPSLKPINAICFSCKKNNLKKIENVVKLRIVESMDKEKIRLKMPQVSNLSCFVFGHMF